MTWEAVAGFAAVFASLTTAIVIVGIKLWSKVNVMEAILKSNRQAYEELAQYVFFPPFFLSLSYN